MAKKNKYEEIVKKYFEFETDDMDAHDHPIRQFVHIWLILENKNGCIADVNSNVDCEHDSFVVSDLQNEGLAWLLNEDYEQDATVTIDMFEDDFVDYLFEKADKAQAKADHDYFLAQIDHQLEYETDSYEFAMVVHKDFGNQEDIVFCRNQEDINYMRIHHECTELKVPEAIERVTGWLWNMMQREYNNQSYTEWLGWLYSAEQYKQLEEAV